MVRKTCEKVGFETRM